MLTFNYENIAFVANCVKNNNVSFITLIRHNRAVSVPNSVQILWNENRMRDFCPDQQFYKCLGEFLSSLVEPSKK